jgi:hypothetical protein
MSERKKVVTFTGVVVLGVLLLLGSGLAGCSWDELLMEDPETELAQAAELDAEVARLAEDTGEALNPLLPGALVVGAAIGGLVSKLKPARTSKLVADMLYRYFKGDSPKVEDLPEKDRALVMKAVNKAAEVKPK